MRKKLQSITLALVAGLLAGVGARAQVGGLTPAAWYRADAAGTLYSNAGTTQVTDGSTVHQWNDFATPGRSLLQASAGSRPSFSSTTLANFNPTVTFDGVNDWMQFTAGVGVNIIDRSEGSIFAAGYMERLKGNGFVGFHPTMDYPGLHTFSNNKLLFFTGGPGYQGQSSESMVTKTFFSAGAGWLNRISGYADATVSLNGTRSVYDASQLNNANLSSNARDLRIGGDSNYGAFSGQLNEILVFGSKLTEDQLDQVETYLAIKYGTTFAKGARNYKSGAGTVVWNASNNASYKNNIAGIANDGSLHQKQSWSTNAGQQVLIGAGNLAATNIANIGSLASGQYLVWGDNGLAKTPTVATNAFPGISHHFSAIWKVQNTGSVTNLRVAWPKALRNLSLIQSNDATIGAGDNATALTGEFELDGVIYNYADVNLPDGSYFTFGAKVPGPGGVTTGLTQWYRADEGIVSGGNGTNVTSWTDFAKGTVSAKIGAAPLPFFKTGATNYFNFNPGVNFTAIQQILGNITTQTLESSSFDIFTLTKEGMTGDRFFNIGMNNTSLNGANWDQPGFYANGRIATRNSTGGGTGILNPGNIPYSTTTPSITYNTFTNTTIQKAVNGGALGTAWNVSARGLSTGGHMFGANGGTNPPGGDDWGFVGNIGEVIIYGNGNLSATDRDKVNSYLALKYGITMPAGVNYLNSSGTVVWNSATNSAYHNNVAGIAADEESAFSQKQSISANKGQQLLIGTSGLADQNASNTTVLSDGQYLIWGDNGLAKTLSVSLPGVPSLNLRFGAIWKVQNSGSVGTVRVTWPAGVPGLTLVQSTDANIDAGDTQTLMTGNTQTINGVPYNYADVTLANGQYFTFAGYVVGPGGVASAAWYRADAAGQLFSDAGTTVSEEGDVVHQWNEFKGTGHNFKQYGGFGRPSFSNMATLANFNPTVTFNNSRLYYDPGNGNTIIDRANGTLYAAGYTKTVAQAGFWGFNESNDDPGLHIFGTQNKLLFYTRTGSGYTGYSSNSFTERSYFTAGGSWQNGTTYLDEATSSLNGIRTNYVASDQILNVLSSDGNARDMMMGWDGNTGAINGQLNELVVFEDKLSVDDMDRVDTYMSIKYGTTFANGTRDYKNSSLGTVWTATTNNGYHYNIAGIARDDEGSLAQKQSWSTNSGRQVLISTTGLENTNAGNTGLLTNGQFLIWGDNNLTKSPSVAITGISDVNFRFASIWKVQNTGSVGTVRVAWPKGYANLKLIQSDDDDITSGDVVTTMTNTQTVNGVEYAYADVTLENGKYFTFAAFLQAPGGVTEGILMWHKANDGVVEGGAKNEWQDVSGNNRDVEQPNDDSYRPSLVTSATHTADSKDYFFNYNPFYYFDGSNDFFYNTDVTYFPATNSPGSVYGVMHNSASGGWRTPYGWGDDDPNLVRGGNDYYVTRDNGTVISEALALNTMPAHIGGFAWRGATNGIYLNMNGRIYPNTTNNIGGIQTAVNFAIGSEGVGLATNGNEPYQGGLPEVFAYSVDHQNSTGDEKVRINSYLAIKYGITLSNDNGSLASDYLSSSSVKVWDATANTGFNSNIAGVAHDFLSALHQKQSRSVNTNTNGQVIMGLGEIAETNVANTNSLADGKFLLWGDNGSTQSLAAASTDFTYAGGTSRRMNRIWKVQNTGVNSEMLLRFPIASVGTTTLAANDLCAGYVILFASDAAFTSNLSVVNLTTNETDYEVLHVFPNGASYFTFAKVTPATSGMVYLPEQTETTTETNDNCNISGAWIYFRKQGDQSLKLLATSGVATTDLSVTITPSGVTYENGLTRTSVMSRIATVTDATSGTYTGVKVRVYYSQEELDNSTELGATTSGWYKYEGTADDVITDIYMDGAFDANKAIALIPNASGVEDGVNYVEFHNITSFSSFVYLSTTKESPLPVTLTRFNVAKEGQTANLSWTTTSEQKSKGFEVQRSTDAKSWKALSFVESQSEGTTSNGTLSYSYSDGTPVQGNNYYRLKAVDLDGTFAYSKIENLNFTGLKQTLVVYPNPVVEGKLTLDLPENSLYSVKVYTISGVEMPDVTKTGNIMDLKGLSSGIYLLQVKLDSGDIQTKTFIVK